MISSASNALGTAQHYPAAHALNHGAFGPVVPLTRHANVTWVCPALPSMFAGLPMSWALPKTAQQMGDRPREGTRGLDAGG